MDQGETVTKDEEKDEEKAEGIGLDGKEMQLECCRWWRKAGRTT